MCPLMLPSLASGDDVYPTKPIRIVHGYLPGISMDSNSRIIAEKLSAMLGQQVVVEGKPGASGTIAIQIVSESKADGYTLLGTPGGGLVASPHLMKLSYDPLRDLAPIAIIVNLQYMFTVHPKVPAKNINELISLAKQKPGSLTYATAGIGTGYHLAAEMFCLMAGIKMTHVPYRGAAAAAIPDLLSGRIDVTINNPYFLLPYVRDNKLRALGVTGGERIKAAPDVPTIAESLTGYEMTGTQGILAPVGTPKEIILLLNDKIQKILSMPDIKKRWESGGQEIPMPHAPDYYGKWMRKNYEQYGDLIKKLGLTTVK